MRAYVIRAGAKVLKVVGSKPLAKHWLKYYRSIFDNVLWEEFIIERKEQQNGKKLQDG